MEKVKLLERLYNRGFLTPKDVGKLHWIACHPGRITNLNDPLLGQLLGLGILKVTRHSQLGEIIGFRKLKHAEQAIELFEKIRTKK